MGRHRKTTKQFKEEIEKISPNIEVLGEYIGVNIPICVRCKKCGHVWQPIPNSLLRGKGCLKCAGHMRKTTEQFKEELTTRLNSNIEVIGEYIGAKAPIKVRCIVCNHIWSPTPSNLLQGIGCPKCARVTHVPVRCVETGEIYPSQTIAAQLVGLKTSAPINQVLHSRAKTAAGYHWEYA